MATRLQLQAELKTVLGSNYVYYDPPESVKLQYPCIIYELASIRSVFADNTRYKGLTSYSVTYIDRNPDSGLPTRLLEMPYSAFDRRYAEDGLYHTVITLYY